jgi:two-component system, NarL family, response regulator LiaR
MSSNTVYAFNLPTDAVPLRVLIVEDDPMMQLGLEQSLMAYPELEIVGQAEDGLFGCASSTETET